jgi:hypothetical protein
MKEVIRMMYLWLNQVECLLHFLQKFVILCYPGLTPKLEHPFIVAVSNDENNVTAQPPLAALNEQPKMTPVAASYFPTPAQKDVTKNTYASIVSSLLFYLHLRGFGREEIVGCRNKF